MSAAANDPVRYILLLTYREPRDVCYSARYFNNGTNFPRWMVGVSLNGQAVGGQGGSLFI